MRDFTLIFGCMFSGKTTRLIEMYTQSESNDLAKLAIKPLLDTRYFASKINTHSGLQLPGHRISKVEEIYPLLTEETREIYIDEIQFFDYTIREAISDLNFKGIRVVAAGLDLDYLGRDFGSMSLLKQMATDRVELHAKCHVCGAPAQYTYRESGNDQLVFIAGNNIYQARCKDHWEEGMQERQSVS